MALLSSLIRVSLFSLSLFSLLSVVVYELFYVLLCGC